MIKAVLFDMDGVLIDAREWHFEALNRALALFGLSISRESHLSTFDGLPTREKLEMLHKSQGLPRGLIEIINALKQRYTLEISAQRCKPVFHHRYALARLRGNGLRLAVCSNSVRATVDALMQYSGLTEHLDLVISNEDVEHAKPDPEMYRTAMRTLALEPEECLVVEDNDHGVQAALASGAHLMRVANPDGVTLQAIERRISEIESAGVE